VQVVFFSAEVVAVALVLSSLGSQEDSFLPESISRFEVPHVDPPFYFAPETERDFNSFNPALPIFIFGIAV